MSYHIRAFYNMDKGLTVIKDVSRKTRLSNFAKVHGKLNLNDMIFA